MAQSNLRIGFMGTPDFAKSALKALVEAGHNIVCVYSQPPRPKGRGHKLQTSPVQTYAEQHDIPVFHPKNLTSQDVQDEFAAHNLDIAIVAAYGLLLPKAVLNAPKYGCVNIHASLLPRWRGASPIQRAIWEGDEQSGVTLMQMDEGLDTGPILAQEALKLSPAETAATLHDRLAETGAKMTLEYLQKLAENGQNQSKIQDSTGVTYAHLLQKEDGKIEWTQTAEQIDRQIRALNPWPGVYMSIENQSFKIKEACLAAPLPKDSLEKNQPVGTLLDKQGNVQCGGSTILTLQTIQPPGKNPMDIASALNGGYLKIGQLLQ